MFRRALCLSAVVTFVLAMASAAPCFAISKEFNQTYPLQPGGSFELQNVNGTVDVQTWDRDEVEVHAVKTAKHQESDLALVSIDVDAKPDAVSVTTRYPQNEDIEVYEGGGAVHAHTTNGNVHLELRHIQDKSGAVAETTNGSVWLAIPAGMQANLEARCLNGSFFSELPLALESSQRPRETHGKLGKGGVPISLHTINGGIRIVALRSTV